MSKNVDVKSVNYEMLVNLKETINVMDGDKKIAIILPVHEFKNEPLINNEGPMGAVDNKGNQLDWCDA